MSEGNLTWGVIEDVVIEDSEYTKIKVKSDFEFELSQSVFINIGRGILCRRRTSR